MARDCINQSDWWDLFRFEITEISKINQSDFVYFSFRPMAVKHTHAWVPFELFASVSKKSSLDAVTMTKFSRPPITLYIYSSFSLKV